MAESITHTIYWDKTTYFKEQNCNTDPSNNTTPNLDFIPVEIPEGVRILGCGSNFPYDFNTRKNYISYDNAIPIKNGNNWCWMIAGFHLLYNCLDILLINNLINGIPEDISVNFLKQGSSEIKSYGGIDFSKINININADLTQNDKDSIYFFMKMVSIYFKEQYNLSIKSTEPEIISFDINSINYDKSFNDILKKTFEQSNTLFYYYRILLSYSVLYKNADHTIDKSAPINRSYVLSTEDSELFIRNLLTNISNVPYLNDILLTNNLMYTYIDTKYKPDNTSFDPPENTPSTTEPILVCTINNDKNVIDILNRTISSVETKYFTKKKTYDFTNNKHLIINIGRCSQDGTGFNEEPIQVNLFYYDNNDHTFKYEPDSSLNDVCCYKLKGAVIPHPGTDSCTKNTSGNYNINISHYHYAAFDEHAYFDYILNDGVKINKTEKSLNSKLESYTSDKHAVLLLYQKMNVSSLVDDNNDYTQLYTYHRSDSTDELNLTDFVHTGFNPPTSTPIDRYKAGSNVKYPSILPPTPPPVIPPAIISPIKSDPLTLSIDTPIWLEETDLKKYKDDQTKRLKILDDNFNKLASTRLTLPPDNTFNESTNPYFFNIDELNQLKKGGTFQDTLPDVSKSLTNLKLDNTGNTPIQINEELFNDDNKIVAILISNINAVINTLNIKRNPENVEKCISLYNQLYDIYLKIQYNLFVLIKITNTNNKITIESLYSNFLKIYKFLKDNLQTHSKLIMNADQNMEKNVKDVFLFKFDEINSAMTLLITELS